MKAYLLIIFFVVVLIYFFGFVHSDEVSVQKIDGVSLVNPHQVIDSFDMAEVKRLQAGWVAIIPFAFSLQGESGVAYNRGRQWWGERLEGTAQLIRLAHQNHLKVMLKPHIWMRGGWIGEFDLKDEKLWMEWEQNYEAYILANVRLADSMNVELFCIGTELRYPVRKRPEFWNSLIDNTRKVYAGQLTYAANWDDYEDVAFWKSLDFIGIDGYFPISKVENPTRKDLEKGWKPIVQKLRAYTKEQQKPILFTEYGYRSALGAAGNHWEINRTNAVTNLEVQQLAYECLYESLWNQDWFGGGFLWKWHFQEHVGGINDNDFTPQGKPVEEIIVRYYKD